MYELVGKQMVDFKDKNSGELIQGIKLHFLGYDDHVSGRVCMVQFVKTVNPCYPKAVGLALGDFTIVYGPKNRVMDILQDSPQEAKK